MMSNFPSENDKIAIIGLGYVGIPLLVEILKTSSKRSLVGFDIDTSKVDFLNNRSSLKEYGYEKNLQEIAGENHLKISNNPDDLINTKIFIITVPTPINEFNIPNLTALKSASRLIGKAIADSDFAKDDLCVAIFESTVYPGATEDVCLPEIQKNAKTKSSHLRLGYSPERINPGDSENKLPNIVKVTSGQDSQTADWVDNFYKTFVSAGTFKVSSIKVAEASKVIENTQRDVNIALANELSLICSRLDIDTNDVLDAACTKWNFMNIRPGLVGGHCIGVDPYYLAHKAESMGIHSKVILSGRQVNDGMPGWIARRAIKKTVLNIGSGTPIRSLVLGISFKENCEDLRNSKSIELFQCLQSYGSIVHITDPMFKTEDLRRISNSGLHDYFYNWNDLDKSSYDLIILAVAHDFYRKKNYDDYLLLAHDKSTFFDLKNCLPRELPNLIRL